MDLSTQVRDLFLLPLAIACISWTVTHEEIFKEPRDFCVRKSKESKSICHQEILLPFYLRVLFFTLYNPLFFDHNRLSSAI